MPVCILIIQTGILSNFFSFIKKYHFLIDKIMEEFVAEYGLILSYIMVILACLGAILAPLIYALTNDPKSLVKIGATLGVLAVLYFIGYAMADGTVYSRFIPNGVTTVSHSQAIGGILVMTYLMMGIAIVGVVVNVISGYLK